MLLWSLTSSMVLSACVEETGSLGINDDADEIAHSAAIYPFTTKSAMMDAVLCNSSNSYIGSIRDPETGSTLHADFAAQFHLQENFKLPERNLMFPQDDKDHSQEAVTCDSCEIRLYMKKVYGDKNNPMKMDLYEMSKEKILKESEDFYSNIDLKQYIEEGAEPIASKIFAPNDYEIDESELGSSTHDDNIRIRLPKSYGTEIMNLYYEHPEYFRDSYSFIQNVCPGFYFKLRSGSGTMVKIYVGTLNLYFSYYDAENRDTTYTGMTRFSATPEVIQTSNFQNSNLQSLAENPECTYLKTPAGICTEVTLPIKEIYAEHSTDSVSKARLTLTRYNNVTSSNFTLDIPQTILLIRKKDKDAFFEERKVSNSQTSFTTTFSSVYNTYTFENLCRLISYCQHEKLKEMADEELTEEEWEAKNPDWNKVLLIPVTTSTTTDNYGYTYETSVRHDMDPSSVRLVGGPNHPLEMQVIYSHFK